MKRKIQALDFLCWTDRHDDLRYTVMFYESLWIFWNILHVTCVFCFIINIRDRLRVSSGLSSQLYNRIPSLYTLGQILMSKNGHLTRFLLIPYRKMGKFIYLLTRRYMYKLFLCFHHAHINFLVIIYMYSISCGLWSLKITELCTGNKLAETITQVSFGNFIFFFVSSTWINNYSASVLYKQKLSCLGWSWQLFPSYGKKTRQTWKQLYRW